MASATDDFNRANGGLGANWTTLSGSTDPVIISNAVTSGDGSFVTAKYSGVSWTADHRSQVLVSNADFGGALARATDDSNYYQVLCRVDFGSYTVDKVVGGSQTQLASGTFTGSTQTFKIQAVGTSITAYKNGTLDKTINDSALSTGSPGLRVRTATVDDFDAADVGAAVGQPTMRRWGGVPAVGPAGMKRGFGGGKAWGYRRSGIFVPRRFTEAA